MTMLYSPNATVRFDEEYLDQLTAWARAKGLKTTLDDDSGYLFLKGKLVPNSFVDLIETQLKSFPIVYGAILSRESLFEEEFLGSLEADELSVLMPTVKELIEQGRVPFLVLREKTKAAAKNLVA